jgi:hypothetical protein
MVPYRKRTTFKFIYESFHSYIHILTPFGLSLEKITSLPEVSKLPRHTNGCDIITSVTQRKLGANTKADSENGTADVYKEKKNFF